MKIIISSLIEFITEKGWDWFKWFEMKEFKHRGHREKLYLSKGTKMRLKETLTRKTQRRHEEYEEKD